MATWVRSGTVVLALAIVGFLGVWQATGLISARGGLGPTILQTQSPVTAILAILMTVGVASVVGGFVARLTTATSGMFILGFSLFALAMKLDGIEEFIYGGGNVTLLIVEVCFVSLVVLLGTLVVFAIGGPLKDVPKPTENQGTNFWKVVLISLAVIPIVWLVAKSPMKGQPIGAAVLAGIAIGFLARQFTPTLQPIILYALPIAAGGLGYFLGMTITQVNDVAIAQQNVSPLLYPMPVEYAAGIIMGLSLGLGWASSLAEKPATKTA